MDWEHHRGSVHHELNYLISEDTAGRVRDFVRSYLDLGLRSVAKPNFSYPVHNLYLDSDDLSFYWMDFNDNEHRWQLKIRYYTVGPGETAHLEIKRRLADVVMRERCAIRQEAVPLVLDGQTLAPSQLVNRDPADQATLERFIAALAKFRARPKLHVSYVRESYISDDGAVRVTMDRKIVCQPSEGEKLPVHLNHPCPLFPPYVLLELNHGPRFPDWFREMVEIFSLTTCDADKYIEGMWNLQHQASGEAEPAEQPAVAAVERSRRRRSP
jgi:hypothetical protein